MMAFLVFLKLAGVCVAELKCEMFVREWKKGILGEEPYVIRVWL